MDLQSLSLIAFQAAATNSYRKRNQLVSFALAHDRMWYLSSKAPEISQGFIITANTEIAEVQIWKGP